MAVVDKSTTQINQTQRTAPRASGGHSLPVNTAYLKNVFGRASQVATPKELRVEVRRQPAADPATPNLITFDPQPLQVGGSIQIDTPAVLSYEQRGSIAELGYYMLGALKNQAKSPSAAVRNQDLALKGA